MFEAISETSIDLKKSNLLHLYHSLNQPQISPGPGLSAQNAEAFGFVIQHTPRSVSIYVGLFFPQAQKRILYRSGPVKMEAVESEMAEMEAFTGDMGFLMTNLHLAQCAPDQRHEILRTCPFFYADVELYYQALSISEIEIKRSQGEGLAKKEAEADLQHQFMHQYVSILSML